MSNATPPRRPINITGRSVTSEQKASHPVGTVFTVTRGGRWIAQVVCAGGALAGSQADFPTERQAVEAARANARDLGCA